MSPDALLTVATFLPACLATAVVCTAIKEDHPGAVVRGSLHLFALIVAGVVAFCGLVHLLTLLPS